MTKEEMLNEVREIASLLEKAPSKAEFMEYSSTKEDYKKYWRTYQEFMNAAGLKYRSRVKGYFEVPDKERLIEAFQEYKKTKGRQPTHHQFHAAYPGLASYVSSYFERYNDFVEAAGGTVQRVYNKNHGRRPWTREELIELIRQDAKECDIPKSGYAFTKKHHISNLWISTLFNGSYEELKKYIPETIQVTRADANPLYQKRYAVQYHPMPVLLKWARRRPVTIITGK